MKNQRLTSIATLILFISTFIGVSGFTSNEKHKKHKTEAKQKKSSLPLMGWASWNNYRVNISEDIIKSQADAMVANGLDKLGYTFINIDDGFFGGRDENGYLLHHPERFPNGMKSLADYIHKNGLKAGIYSDAGINTCASYWDKDTIGVGMGLFGHEEQDLKLFIEDWGYDFIKIDWCGGQWMDLDEETRYTEIANYINDIDENVVYNVCRWEFPGQWVTSIADSWRISGDIANNFNSVMHIVDINADLWRHCSNGHFNDMDMLQVGRGMSYEEDKTHFTMWSILNSPLMLGSDLTKLTEETLSIISNTEIIALNQSKFVYQARRIIDNGDLEVWAKPLVSSMSGQVAVVLLNRSSTSQELNFDLEAVGVNSEKGYTTRDLWSSKETSKSTNSNIAMEVPSHGVVVLKLNGTSLPFNVFQFKDKQDK